MKTKISYTLFLGLISLLIFNSINAVNKGSPPVYEPGKKMVITAMHAGFHPSDQCSTEFSSYNFLKDTLGFNSWHRYGCWFPGDNVFGDSTAIAQGIANTLSQNNSHGLRTIFDRPIIRYLAYGQRSDYQCEQIPTGSDYYFHSFDSSVTNSNVHDMNDYSFNGGGAKVKHAGLNGSIPGSLQGYIVSHLRSNREQCNRIIDHTRDDNYNWYVRPRIRVDSAFVNDNTNLEAKICRIDILDWNGDLTESVILRAMNFRESLSSIYNANYADTFSFISWGNDTTDLILEPTQLCPDPIKNSFDWGESIEVDFRVYWYGNCDMWIDYIRLEDEPAKQLFEVSTVNRYLTNRLSSEINLALSNYNATDPIPNNFYNEEFEFNMTPCTQKLSKIIDSVSQGRLSMMVNLNMDMYNAHIPRFWENHIFTAYDFKKYLIDSSKITTILPNPYFLEGWLQNDTFVGNNRESYNPNTLPVYSEFPGVSYDPRIGLLAYPTSPTQYDSWLQFNLDERDFAFDFLNVMKITDELSKITSVDIIDLHQSHMWNQWNHKLKEPTNEELEMTANLALSYGAKGFMYFAYNGNCTGNGYQTDYTPTGNPLMFSAGFVDKQKNVRDSNAYGQNKWSFYRRYHRILKQWEPYLMGFDSDRHSYVSRLEWVELISNTYVHDVITYKPGTEGSPCDNSNNPSGTTAECIDDRYLQIATFHDDKPNTQYCMIVNRRCSPFIDTISNDRNGGRRFVQIKLDSNSSSFAGFNNWNIYDLSNDSIVSTFNKGIISWVNLGWFLPGEGKLYKLTPVMQEGGTLVADEDCGGFEFECRGEVNNNGHDITIVPNTTIVFVNTSARIIMNGGSFKSGIYPEESLPITLKSVGTSTWKGLKLTECDEVEMHQTYFENISSYPIDSTYAAELTDCGSITVSNCTFQASSTGRTGSLLLSYSSQADPDDVYIFSNHFKLNTGSLPAVSVIATGYVGIPVLFEWNEFESSSENNTLAILLSNVTGGAIKENNFTGYDNTVMMLESSVDLYGNYILGSDQSSKGIIQYSTSSANLSPSGGIFTGGYNTIAVEGSSATCMQFSNSFLLIDEGYNIFSLAGSETNNWQLEGIILDEVYGNPYPAERNCFKIGNDLIVKHNLKYPDDVTIVLDTLPASCEPEEQEGLMVFDLGNGISDTLHYFSGGSGSGSGESNVKLEIKNYKYGVASGAGSISETVTLKALNDSVSINLRKRNYERVSVLCMEMLTDYSDSIKDASLISKLYLAELKLDTNQIRMSELKSFLESYILNNPE
ncbi:MAG: hypothetical protein WBC65_17005, partial [Ignavibacteria bacterium]